MPDYAKMYFLLCAAVDRSLDELQRIPLAAPAAAQLQNALLQAEAIYIETSPTLPEQAPCSGPLAPSEGEPSSLVHFAGRQGAACSPSVRGCAFYFSGLFSSGFSKCSLPPCFFPPAAAQPAKNAARSASNSACCAASQALVSKKSSNACSRSSFMPAHPNICL